MSNTDTMKIVKKYAEKLEREKYPFKAIYLFGSFSNGKAGKYSDIDVAVVSNKLKKNWNLNEDMLWKYTIDVDPRIEPIGFTEEEFKDDGNPMVYEIKKKGIRIK